MCTVKRSIWLKDDNSELSYDHKYTVFQKSGDPFTDMPVNAQQPGHLTLVAQDRVFNALSHISFYSCLIGCHSSLVP